tara:strand:+ start:472 stop:1080 length:609 start_codon:yes stop_codon:yes gene_type:complete
MKKVFLSICILTTLFSACKKEEIEGCTDDTACNYNDVDAAYDNGACTYAEAYLDCDDVCLNDTDGDGICDEYEVPKVIGTWQIVQTQTTHELGHYGPYDPPVRIVDSRETLVVDHQTNLTIVDVNEISVTWDVYDSIPKLYDWTLIDDLFVLNSSIEEIAYHVVELTDDSFEFFIKDFSVYNDSTSLIAYEEFKYTYLLEKL